MYCVRNAAPLRVSGKKLTWRVPASTSRTAPRYSGRQELTLIDHDTARAAVAGADQLGHISRHFLAPVPRAPRRAIAIMAAVHRPDHPAAAVAVVVIVAREDVAERVQAGLVIVALAVANDLELRAVAIDAQRVGQLIARDMPAALVDDIEVLRPLGVILLNRAAAVAVAEIELAIEPQHHAVHAVVGVDAAEPGQEGIAFIGLVVTVGVFEHEQVGAIADEHAASLVFAGLVVMFFDGDAHGHGKDAVGEYGRLVGLAVAVGVFEDLDLVGILDAVKPPVAAASESIVQPLGDPDPPSRIDVDIGGIDEQAARPPTASPPAPRPA